MMLDTVDFELVYMNAWTGGDIPAARAAVLSSISYVIGAIAEEMSDGPQSYEEAATDEMWKKRLTEMLVRHSRQCFKELP